MLVELGIRGGHNNSFLSLPGRGIERGGALGRQGSYGLRWAGEITKSSLNWHRNNIAAAQLASARRPVSAVPVRQSRADPQAGCRLRPSSSRLPGRGGLLGTPLTLGDY